jgi:hypothetical protein
MMRLLMPRRYLSFRKPGMLRFSALADTASRDSRNFWTYCQSAPGQSLLMGENRPVAGQNRMARGVHSRDFSTLRLLRVQSARY